jgi:hypothetical protein
VRIPGGSEILNLPLAVKPGPVGVRFRHLPAHDLAGRVHRGWSHRPKGVRRGRYWGGSSEWMSHANGLSGSDQSSLSTNPVISPTSLIGRGGRRNRFRLAGSRGKAAASKGGANSVIRYRFTRLPLIGLRGDHLRETAGPRQGIVARDLAVNWPGMHRGIQLRARSA